MLTRGEKGGGNLEGEIMGLYSEVRMNSEMAIAERIPLVQERDDNFHGRNGDKIMSRGSLISSDHDEDDEEVEYS
ncbi:hypothetical protein L2E82_02839 [Cichorium intybus]|uniref:Uncharacterized protein n=1 Tax=Cichorium intybus TaxID=13427 RepID=A0ACB9H2S2_CICIN|nr:hypothetical protein L2E82_02839 [Cichorium intybus]